MDLIKHGGRGEGGKVSVCQAGFALQQLCCSAWESCNGASPQTLHRCLCCSRRSSQGLPELCFPSFSSPNVSLGSFLLVPMATPTFGVTAMLLQPRHQRHRSGRSRDLQGWHAPQGHPAAPPCHSQAPAHRAQLLTLSTTPAATSQAASLGMF